MTTRDWIEVVFTLLAAGNVYIMLVVRYEVLKSLTKLEDKFLSKEDFDRFTDTLYLFIGAKPISHRRTKP
jgi:hypothetical protein